MLRIKRMRENSKAKIVGALFGLFIFPASLIGLFLNEGRVNFGTLAEASIPVASNTIDRSLTGSLIAVQGSLFSDERLGDPQFIAEGNHIQLERRVEMFAWHEETSTDSQDDERVYTYSQYWTEEPPDSGAFEFPENMNPPKRFPSRLFSVHQVHVGEYTLDARSVDFPEAEPLELTDATLLENALKEDLAFLEGSYIFIGTGTFNDPKIGDLRISFFVVPHAATATAFGQAQEDRIVPHRVTGSQSLYRVFFNGRETAILQMHDEYTDALWAGRFIGFAAMWCGIFLIINPLTIVMTVIPLFNRLGIIALLGITLPIAGALSAITILVSYIAHNPWLVAGIGCIFALVVFAGGGLTWVYQRRNSHAAQ